MNWNTLPILLARLQVGAHLRLVLLRQIEPVGETNACPGVEDGVLRYQWSRDLDLFDQGRAELEALVASGGLRYRETIATGIENAPEAFIGMLNGRNLGKQLVKLT